MTKQQTYKRKYGANQFSASKLYRGKQITVRMVSPDTSKGIPKSGIPWLVHRNSFKVKKPTPVTGNYLPSRFEVENFGCEISFTLEAVKGKQGRSSVQITELSCSQGVTLQLPLALLRTLALRACTFSAYLLPPHFTYKPFPNVTVTIDKEGGFEIMGSAKLPREILQDLHSSDEDKTDKLKRVWELYNSAEVGVRYATVAEGFGYPPGSRAGIEWAHKWVKLARKKFAPKTVRKSQQRKGKK
jgi:hypothetical protein